jgi:hypothetical protein
MPRSRSGRGREEWRISWKPLTKGPYHKTKHGFALLAVIEPKTVIAASEHASKLRDVLDEWLDDR